MKAPPAQYWRCPKCDFILGVFVPPSSPPTHYHERGNKAIPMVPVDKAVTSNGRLRPRGRGTTGGGGTSPSGRPTGGDTDPDNKHKEDG